MLWNLPPKKKGNTKTPGKELSGIREVYRKKMQETKEGKGNSDIGVLTQYEGGWGATDRGLVERNNAIINVTMA